MALEEQHILLPFNEEKIKDKHLVTTFFGSWAMLDEEEWKCLLSRNLSKELETKLHEKDIIASKENINRIIKNYRNLNANLFLGPSLHIVSLTPECNLGCVYCHAKDRKIEKMSRDTALKVLNFIFQSPSKAITIEFQGGEPLLNWDVLKFIAEEARKINKIENKDLKITIVSNLTSIKEEHIDFILDNDITVCTSLDGQKSLHDMNRHYISGKGSYDDVISGIRKINALSIKKNSRKIVGALPTITRNSLPYWKEIVDEYAKQGFDSIHMRFLNYLGVAKENWKEIGYTAEEFLKFWRSALDYILELNKKGTKIKETTSVIMLKKILLKKDALYTELMSPCGAGRSQILYSENGDVFTCDEARMTGNDLFKLGNVENNRYEEVLGSPNMFYMAGSSAMNLYSPLSAFLPWIGTCPVINHSEQGNVLPKISCSMRHIIYTGQFRYIFEKMAEGKENREIFKNWISD
ncbi:MAG: His-Xaa-Ser system radical SAM maturase HxsB [archaeon]